MNRLFGWYDPSLSEPDARRLALQLGGNEADGRDLDLLQQGHYLLARNPAGGSSSAQSLAIGTTAELPERYAEDGHGDRLAGVRGQFAWSATNGRGLAVAVDRFASIPIFYFRTPETLIFSSDLHLLLAHPALADPDINPQAIFDYLFFAVVPGHLSIYRGIEKLAPGNLLLHSPERLQTGHYWLPDFTRDRSTDARALEAQAVDALAGAVAIPAGLEKPGCFLSGGLDSSSVCGLASRHNGPGVKAFTIGFDEADFDESEYAAVAARQYELDWHNETITADDIQSRIDAVVAAYAEPFGNSSAVSALICAEIAADHGVRNLLAGDGGDELFAGNDRYQKQMVFGYYERVPGLLRSLFLDPLVPLAGQRRWGPLAKAGSYVSQARVPLPDRLYAYNLLARNAPDRVLTPEFLADIDIESPYRYARSIYDTPQSADALDRMLFLDWTLTLADNDLPKVRGTCEIAGVDVHFPMLDAAVVDLSIRVPSADKLDLRHLRKFYKRAFGEVLPREILTKPKHGFGVPVGLWFEKSPALGERLHAALASLRKRGIIQPAFIDELLRLQRTEHAVYYGALNWTLFMFEEWLAYYRPSV